VWSTLRKTGHVSHEKFTIASCPRSAPYPGCGGRAGASSGAGRGRFVVFARKGPPGLADGTRRPSAFLGVMALGPTGRGTAVFGRSVCLSRGSTESKRETGSPENGPILSVGNYLCLWIRLSLLEKPPSGRLIAINDSAFLSSSLGPTLGILLPLNGFFPCIRGSTSARLLLVARGGPRTSPLPRFPFAEEVAAGAGLALRM